MGKKRPTRPTRRQKEVMRKKRFVPKNWLVVSESNGELTLINKETKNLRTITI